MNKFKSSFYKREQLVLALINATTEGQLLIQKIIGSNNDADIELYKQNEKPYESTENNTILQRRIQELQKINDDLLSELRLANRKLLDSKYLANKSPSRESAHPYAKTASNFYNSNSRDKRGYSHSSAERHDPLAEDKKELRDRLFQFQADLSHKSYKDQIIIDTHEVLSQRVEYYFGKLRVTSVCINRFLSAMQKLQRAVLRKDEITMAKNKGDFELNKSQLLTLAKELRIFEVGDAMSCTIPADSPGKQYSSHTLPKTEAYQDTDFELKKRIYEEEKAQFAEERRTLLQKIEELSTTLVRETSENMILKEAKSKLFKENQALSSQLTKKKEIPTDLGESLLRKTVKRLEENLKQRDQEIAQLKFITNRSPKVAEKIGELFEDAELANKLQFKIIQEKIEAKFGLIEEIKEKLNKRIYNMQQELYLAIQDEQSNTLIKAQKIAELELKLAQLQKATQQHASIQEKEAQSNIDKYQKLLANTEKQLQLKNAAYENLEKNNKIKLKEIEDRVKKLQDQVKRESLARSNEQQKSRKLEEEKAKLQKDLVSQSQKIQHILDEEKKKKAEEQVIEFSRRKRRSEPLSITKTLQANFQAFNTKCCGHIATQLAKINHLKSKLNQLKTKLIKSRLIASQEIEKNQKFEIDTKKQLDLYEESIAGVNSENEVLQLQITELELAKQELETNNAMLSTQVSSLEEENTTLKKNNEEISDQFTKSLQERDYLKNVTLQKATEHKSKEKEQIVSKLKTFSELMSAKQTRLLLFVQTKLNNVHSHFKTSISQIVSTKVSKLFEEIFNLRKSNLQFSKLNESLKTEIQSLKTSKIEKENQLVKSTTTENTSLHSQIEDLTEKQKITFSSHKKLLIKLSNSFQELFSNKLLDITNSFSKEFGKMQSVEVLVQNMKITQSNIIKIKNKTILNLQKDLEQRKKQVQNLSNLEDDIVSLKNTLKHNQVELAEALNNIATLETENSNLEQNHINDLNKEHLKQKQLENQITEKTTQITIINSKYKKILEQIIQKAEHAFSISITTTLEPVISNLQRKLTDLQPKLILLKTKNDQQTESLQKTILEQRDLLKKKTEQIMELESNIEVFKNSNTELREKLLQANTQSENILVQTKKLITESLPINIKNNTEELCNKFDTFFSKKFTRVFLQFQTLKESQKLQITRYKTKIEELKTQLEHLELEKESLLSELREKSAVQYQNINKELANQLKESEQLKRDLTIQTILKTKFETKYKNIIQRIPAFSKKLKSEFQETLSILRREVVFYQDQLNKDYNIFIKKTIDSCQRSISLKNAEMSNYKTQIQEAQKINISLSNEKEKLQNENVALKSQLEFQILNLETERKNQMQKIQTISLNWKLKLQNIAAAHKEILKEFNLLKQDQKNQYYQILFEEIKALLSEKINNLKLFYQKAISEANSQHNEKIQQIGLSCKRQIEELEKNHDIEVNNITREKNFLAEQLNEVSQTSITSEQEVEKTRVKYQKSTNDLTDELNSSKKIIEELKNKLELSNTLHNKQLKKYKLKVTNFLSIMLKQLQEIKNSKMAILELISPFQIAFAQDCSNILEQAKNLNDEYNNEYDAREMAERHLQEISDQAELQREEDIEKINKLNLEKEDYDSLISSQAEQISSLNQELTEKTLEVYELQEKSAVSSASKTLSSGKNSGKIKQMLQTWAMQMKNQFEELEENINCIGDEVMTRVNSIDLNLYYLNEVCKNLIYSLHERYTGHFSKILQIVLDRLLKLEKDFKSVHTKIYSSLSDSQNKWHLKCEALNKKLQEKRSETKSEGKLPQHLIQQYEEQLEELEDELSSKKETEKIIKIQLNEQMIIYEQKDKEMAYLKKELEIAKQSLKQISDEKMKLQSENEVLLHSRSPPVEDSKLGIKNEHLQVPEAKSINSEREGSNSSFKGVPMPQRYFTSSKISGGFNSEMEYRHFRAHIIKCMEFIPLNLIKTLDGLLQALQKYLEG